VAESESLQDVLSLSVRDFLAATAATQPTPGGGSVAAVVGCLAAALGQMALGYTRGRKAFAQHAQFHDALARRLQRVRAMFEDLVGDDIQAYQLCVEAREIKPGPEKEQATQIALAAAIDVPKELAKLCLAVLADLVEFSDKCNPRLMSDLKAAAALAAAVVRLSWYNVEANVADLDDSQAAGDLRQGSKADLEKAVLMLGKIENA